MADPPNPTDPPSPPTPPAPSTGFTQEQLNDAAGRARNEGRSAAERDLLSALGIKDLDEGKGLIERLKTIDDKNKDELTRAAEKATKAESELEKLKGDHGVATLNSRIERSVLTKLLGEDGQNLLKKAEIIRRLVDVDSSVDDKDLEKTVEELAKTMPELFATVGGDPGGDGKGKPPARPAAPPGRPAPGGGGGASTPKDAATARLHERHPRTRPQ